MFYLTQMKECGPSNMDVVFVPQDSVNSYNTRLSKKGNYVLPKVNGFGSNLFLVFASKHTLILITIKHLQ